MDSPEGRARATGSLRTEGVESNEASLCVRWPRSQDLAYKSAIVPDAPASCREMSAMLLARKPAPRATRARRKSPRLPEKILPYP